MNTLPPSLEALARFIPTELLHRSGKAFYSGRSAFGKPNPLYVLGLNPGGDPDENAEETIQSHTAILLRRTSHDWSAYRDESWGGVPAGTWKMQPRVLHMFRSLGINPGSVPSSNLVFVRSRDEASLHKELPSLLKLCWPFHLEVLKALRPRVVLCFGKTAGDHVRAELGAHSQYAEFIEANRRKWSSRSYRSTVGHRVVVATHPSRANWQESAADPTPLIAAALHDA